MSPVVDKEKNDARLMVRVILSAFTMMVA